MLENLKIDPIYDGFVFLAESSLNPPILKQHHHVELELNVVLSGEISYIIDEQKVNYRQGDLLWFHPLQEHQLVNRSPDAKYYVAVFTPDLVKKCFTPIADHNKGKDKILRSVLPPKEFDNLCRVMDQLISDGPDNTKLNAEAGFGFRSSFRYSHSDAKLLNTGLHYLLSLAWRYQSERRIQKDIKALHPSVLKAMHLLNNETEILSLKELASGCNVSPSYLSRTFHKQLGVTISNYRNGLRLKHFWNSYYGGKDVTILEAVYNA